jgi:ParB family chromosome partitioning protein
MSDEISMIPIGQICIVNPRYRDQKKFELIVENIKNVGLKMPIRVSPRTAGEQNGFKYDLVCGQGRLEAFKVLGYAEIPAMVGDLPREELLLCSLVENIARRYPQPMDLLREIERLKAEGYSYAKIAEKIDAHEDLVRGLAALKSQGEERLLDAALKGKIPMWIAVDIAKTDTLETQRDLLKAYENKQLTRAALKYIKGLSADDVARMQHEMESLERDLKTASDNYMENMFTLQTAQTYIKNLLKNTKVAGYLAKL